MHADDAASVAAIAPREGFMAIRLGAPGPLVLSVLALALASPAWAQAPAGGPQAPAGESPPAASPPAAASTPMPIHQPQPTTVPGRPDIPNAEVNAKLRSTAPPPIPAAEDKLPVAQLKVPKGFKVEVYASGIGNARSLRLGD